MNIVTIVTKLDDFLDQKFDTLSRISENRKYISNNLLKTVNFRRKMDLM